MAIAVKKYLQSMFYKVYTINTTPNPNLKSFTG